MLKKIALGMNVYALVSFAWLDQIDWLSIKLLSYAVKLLKLDSAEKKANDFLIKSLFAIVSDLNGNHISLVYCKRKETIFQIGHYLIKGDYYLTDTLHWLRCRMLVVIDGQYWDFRTKHYTAEFVARNLDQLYIILSDSKFHQFFLFFFSFFLNLLFARELLPT